MVSGVVEYNTVILNHKRELSNVFTVLLFVFCYNLVFFGEEYSVKPHFHANSHTKKSISLLDMFRVFNRKSTEL